MKGKFQKKKGFAMFSALLLVAVVSAVAYGISAIGQKELKFVRAGLESHRAYVASEIGLECAQYYLFKEVVNPDLPSFNFTWPFTPPYTSFNISCLSDNDSSLVTKWSDANVGKLSFSVNIGDSQKSCANVYVDRTYASGLLQSTVIRSEGQNVECGASISESTVQRSVRVTY